jgi:hypothetical protein
MTYRCDGDSIAVRTLWTFFVFAIVILGSFGCSGGSTEWDDFGSPAYTRIQGIVFDSDGSRASAGMEVLLTLCEMPIGGFAGRTVTTEDGEYDLTGELPAVGFPAGADSVSVVCQILVGDDFASSGEIEVYFYLRPVDQVAVRTVNVE